jgi:hypothetical protein
MSVLPERKAWRQMALAVCNEAREVEEAELVSLSVFLGLKIRKQEVVWSHPH